MKRVEFPPSFVARTGRRWLVPVLVVTALLAGALAHGVTAQQPATVLYVDVDATGAGDGTSWADAYVHLQDALDEVNTAPDPALEIWIAAGVYYPDVDADGDHVPGSPDESFTLARDGLRLYGGFDPGSGATAFDQRDPVAYPTVLSADVDRNDLNVDGNGIAETWVDVQGVNAYHVLYLDGRSPHPITGNTVVDGLIITAGQAGGSYPQDRGGGLYCRAGRTIGSGAQDEGVCSPAIVALVFRGNQATNGGGIYHEGTEGGISSPTLENVLLSGNLAAAAGGGIHNNGFYGTASPTLVSVTFDGNEASDGGGMANVAYSESGEASPVVHDSLFQNNRAVDGGGAIYNYPDLSGTSRPFLKGVTFRANEAGGSGGGMLSRAYSGTSSPVLIDVEFERNRSGGSGGGVGVISVYGGHAAPVLIGVTFQGNVAAGHGGGMALDQYGSTANASLTNVLFSGNQAGGDGGALYNAGGAATLTNVTFSANRASGQGGALANAYLDLGLPHAILINGILWGNSARAGQPEIYDAEGASTVRDSLVEGGFAGGTGIIDADPLFVRHPDPGADGAWGTPDDDYGDLRLQPTSPALDVGDDSALPADTYDLDGDGDTAEPVPFDLDGSARFAGQVDLGAYEAAGGADLAISQYLPIVQAPPAVQITYTLAFTNYGPQPATGVIVTDVVPLDSLSGVSYESTLPITPLGDVPYAWQVAPLAAGAGGTIRITGALTRCLAAGTYVSNSVEIGAAEVDAEMGNNADEAGITVLNAPPLAHSDSFTTSGGVLRVAPGASVLSNDVDANCDPLTAILVQDVATGALHLDVSGSLIYTAPVGFDGIVTFVYQATDGQEMSAPVTSQIVVHAGEVIYRVFLPMTARR
ncbi:MAG TPA: Ig-like domain-containing protein [Anaerolineae bacterium]|nr:Ig-like domain-containing protein [Anaerolineae bacterium]